MVIKDLINEVAEERKKLATLQIEVDRLRKLTTTVWQTIDSHEVMLIWHWTLLIIWLSNHISREWHPN